MAYLTDEPLDLAALVAAVSRASLGGVVSFVGVVRDAHAGRGVVSLAYSAYRPMAEAVCAEIVREAGDRWPVQVALSHRLGELAIGDAAVIVAVAGTHRDEAFAACIWIVDELKRRVPIWKRERYADGTEAWVDPTAPAGVVEVGAR